MLRERGASTVIEAMNDIFLKGTLLEYIVSEKEKVLYIVNLVNSAIFIIFYTSLRAWNHIRVVAESNELLKR